MISPLYMIDFYKVGHVSQYPEGTTQVWSNWTPRSTRIPGQERVVFFGLQYFLKTMQEEWQRGFFSRSEAAVLAEYKEIIGATLGGVPYVGHIQRLHRLGYLPLAFYALPEGDSVPLNCPMLVVTNTHPEMFWLPNYIETIMSARLWKACTSATTAQRYRRLFIKWAQEAGEKDMGFVDWMGHDFSFRGMGGLEDAVLSGMGHLLSFSGTDTIPAILAAREYYGAPLSVGGSVPATEHSVMCAGQEANEFDTFTRLLKMYPDGVLSVVSDTWDLWRVLTDYIPRLKETILARNGKLVIRPDSGDPVKIVCGDPAMRGVTHRYGRVEHHPAYYGTLRLLAEALGVDSKRDGLPLIRGAGVIYGDSITPERADAILSRTVREHKLSPYNCVFGIGSYTYVYTTRDTYGFAMKATAVQRGGRTVNIFKNPITDFGAKKSHNGIPAVFEREESTATERDYFVQDGCAPEMLEDCAFRRVWVDGKLLVEDSFQTIRGRARA